MQHRDREERAADRNERDGGDPRRVEGLVGRLVHDEPCAAGEEHKSEEQLDEVGRMTLHQFPPTLASTSPGSKRRTSTWPAPTRSPSRRVPGAVVPGPV